jgi:hypothetical protein
MKIDTFGLEPFSSNVCKGLANIEFDVATEGNDSLDVCFAVNHYPIRTLKLKTLDPTETYLSLTLSLSSPGPGTSPKKRKRSTHTFCLRPGNDGMSLGIWFGLINKSVFFARVEYQERVNRGEAALIVADDKFLLMQWRAPLH